MTKQVLIIHGGSSFSSYDEYLTNLRQSEITYERITYDRDWRDGLAEALPDADILTPTMPNAANAQFDEWSIKFEKIIPLLGDDVTLIGYSLGAMFLAKYLHSTPLDQPVKQLILLGAGYDEDVEDYGQFKVTSATGIERSADEIHIMHSKDDFVVPYEALDKYARDVPTATIHRFIDKNHFLDEDFPELLELLKQK